MQLTRPSAQAFRLAIARPQSHPFGNLFREASKKVACDTGAREGQAAKKVPLEPSSGGRDGARRGRCPGYKLGKGGEGGGGGRVRFDLRLAGQPSHHLASAESSGAEHGGRRAIGEGGREGRGRVTQREA